jgi:hypothetical protein
MIRKVNEVELQEIYGWTYGPYLITTDSFAASATGLGYFTVSLGNWGTADPGRVDLVYIDRALSLADAVTMAKCHMESGS